MPHASGTSLLMPSKKLGLPDLFSRNSIIIDRHHLASTISDQSVWNDTEGILKGLMMMMMILMNTSVDSRPTVFQGFLGNGNESDPEQRVGRQWVDCQATH